MYREEEPHNNHETPGRQTKQSNFLFPIKIIAKLEWAQSNAQQNIEQPQNPTMGVTINNESTTTENAKMLENIDLFFFKPYLICWHFYMNEQLKFHAQLS